MIKLLCGLLLISGTAFAEDYISFSTNVAHFEPVTTVVFGPGEVTWKKGYMEFKGAADESAKAFFKILKPYVDNYIEARCKCLPKSLGVDDPQKGIIHK